MSLDKGEIWTETDTHTGRTAGKDEGRDWSYVSINQRAPKIANQPTGVRGKTGKSRSLRARRRNQPRWHPGSWILISPLVQAQPRNSSCWTHPRSLFKTSEGEVLIKQIHLQTYSGKPWSSRGMPLRKWLKCFLWRWAQKIRRWIGARDDRLGANGICNQCHYSIQGSELLMLIRAKQALHQSVPIVMLWQAHCRSVIVHPHALMSLMQHLLQTHKGPCQNGEPADFHRQGAAWVTLGKSRPQLPRWTISKLRVCPRQFCTQQRQFLLASALLAQSTWSVPEWACPQQRFPACQGRLCLPGNDGGISGCHNQQKEYYWYQVGRGQGCCKMCRLALHNKELSDLKCQ